jgi:hypothetical protein
MKGGAAMKDINLYDYFRKIWYPQTEDSLEIQNHKLRKISDFQKSEIESLKNTINEFIKLKN